MIDPITDLLGQWAKKPPKVITTGWEWDGTHVTHAEAWVSADDGFYRKVTVELIASSEHAPSASIRIVDPVTGHGFGCAMVAKRDQGDHPFVITAPTAPAWHRRGWED